MGKEMIRPMISYTCLIALIIFYFLTGFGYQFPPQIHGLWTPVIWWFGSRQIDKYKEGKS